MVLFCCKSPLSFFLSLASQKRFYYLNLPSSFQRDFRPLNKAYASQQCPPGMRNTPILDLGRTRGKGYIITHISLLNCVATVGRTLVSIKYVMHWPHPLSWSVPMVRTRTTLEGRRGPPPGPRRRWTTSWAVLLAAFVLVVARPRTLAWLLPSLAAVWVPTGLLLEPGQVVVREPDPLFLAVVGALVVVVRL